jgi:hypothetical protein
VQKNDIAMVRAEYDCQDGMTVTTFNSAAMREAMSKVADGAGFQHVVKQANNWMLTADD